MHKSEAYEWISLKGETLLAMKPTRCKKIFNYYYFKCGLCLILQPAWIAVEQMAGQGLAWLFYEWEAGFQLSK